MSILYKSSYRPLSVCGCARSVKPTDQEGVVLVLPVLGLLVALFDQLTVLVTRSYVEVGLPLVAVEMVCHRYYVSLVSFN